MLVRSSTRNLFYRNKQSTQYSIRVSWNVYLPEFIELCLRFMKVAFGSYSSTHPFFNFRKTVSRRKDGCVHWPFIPLARPLFLKIKIPMKGYRFSSTEEIQTRMTEVVEIIPKEEFFCAYQWLYKPYPRGRSSIRGRCWYLSLMNGIVHWNMIVRFEMTRRQSFGSTLLFFFGEPIHRWSTHGFNFF